MSDNSFPKEQRLSSPVAIENLFRDGDGGFVFPFKYVVANGGESTPSGVRMLVSVGKKNHRRANKRNLIKRKTREAYRLSKAPMLSSFTQSGRSVDLALIYVSKQVEDYKIIESAIQRIILKISESN